jgi:hypothetical protein
MNKRVYGRWLSGACQADTARCRQEGGEMRTSGPCLEGGERRQVQACEGGLEGRACEVSDLHFSGGLR